jgi:tryptophan halogenase
MWDKFPNLTSDMINHLLVLGGGSAGFLAAITVKHRNPDLRITVLRSKDIGIIGVGEGTTVPVLNHLHGYLRMDFTDFHRIAQPTWKLGIRFLWGPRPYFDYGLSRQLDIHYDGMTKVIGFYLDDVPDFGFASFLMTHNTVFPRRGDGLPHITQDPAYHIENEHFVAFLEKYAAQLGIEILDGTVVEVVQDEAGIAGLRLDSGQMLTADLYVDSSGFRSLLLGQTLQEPFASFKSSLFCDRAVVGGWQRTDEPIKPYTTAETMTTGWCWQIDHEFRINRGYVYSSDFIGDDEAEREFRGKNPKVSQTRVVKFRTGRYERSWVKNVVAVGNAAGFVEPLESTSLGIICLDSHALAEALADCDREPRPTVVRQYNRRTAIMWEITREFLALHYKFNKRLPTPFWKACLEKTDLRSAQEFVEFYQENGPSTLWRPTIIDPRNPFGFEGYLSMMLGMNIAYRKTFTLPPRELKVRDAIYQKLELAARGGTTVKETLDWIRKPGWQWPGNIYRPAQ